MPSLLSLLNWKIAFTEYSFKILGKSCRFTTVQHPYVVTSQILTKNKLHIRYSQIERFNRQHGCLGRHFHGHFTQYHGSIAQDHEVNKSIEPHVGDKSITVLPPLLPRHLRIRGLRRDDIHQLSAQPLRVCLWT